MGKYRHRSGALKLVLTIVTVATLVSDSVETAVRLKYAALMLSTSELVVPGHSETQGPNKRPSSQG